jgi:hypothetical protein
MSSQPYPNAQAIFYQQYEMVRRDEVVGVLLALFLGGFGIHHFYLRRTGLGILYICFCWTAVSRSWALSSASSCPAGCGSSTPSRRRELRPRWASRCRDGTYPWNVTINVPPAPQPGTLLRSAGAADRPTRRRAILLRMRGGVSEESYSKRIERAAPYSTSSTRHFRYSVSGKFSTTG